jgi:hypothetical protein
LNPHNGPGASLFPDTDYSKEIAKLNAEPNVCTIGYVRINYCEKDITKVYEEVDKYAGWAEDHAKSGIAVHGIFFDETPNHYSPRVAAYLNIVTQRVKDSPGILGDRLVNNPSLYHGLPIINHSSASDR